MRMEDNHETVKIEMTYEEAELLLVFLSGDDDGEQKYLDTACSLEEKLDEYVNT